jgi:hypothetical protein
VTPSLKITSPASGAAVERGGQLSITWTGVLVPQVVILLVDRRSNATTRTLAVMANTGHYHWTAPLDPGMVGEYDLVIQGVEAGAPAAAAPIDVAQVGIVIVDPPPQPASLLLADPPVPSTWTEGDVITVTYTSQGVVDPVLVQVFSLSEGLLFNVTAEGPTAGSISFVAPAPPQDPIPDAYILLSTEPATGWGAVSARTGPVTYFKARQLSQVALPATTLYKGAQYEVTWRAAGKPFPVAVMLYAGTAQRVTEAGKPCVPWRDAAGQKYTGCVLSYDLVNEVCATAVDYDGLLVEAGQCKPATTAFALVLTVPAESPIMSSDGRATLALPASLTELPVPGPTYTVVVAAATAGAKEAARSPPFSIEAPAVRLDFGILAAPNTPAATAAAAAVGAEPPADLVADFLAGTLGVSRSRVGVQLAEAQARQGGGGAAEPTPFRVLATIAPAPDATRVSAVEAGEAYIRNWPNLNAPLPTGLDAAGFQLDASVPPSMSLVGSGDDEGARHEPAGRRQRRLAAVGAGRVLAPAVDGELASEAPEVPTTGPSVVSHSRPVLVVIVGVVAVGVLLAVMGVFVARRWSGGAPLFSGSDLRVHALDSLAARAHGPGTPSSRV